MTITVGHAEPVGFRAGLLDPRPDRAMAGRLFWAFTIFAVSGTRP
jgi:hypothetical protein